VKKWSISLLALAGLVIVAAIAPAISSAASASPYCPEGQTGTPPYCTTPPPPPPPPTCASGQVGTYPNCVTPSLGVSGIKIKPNSTTLVLNINAPGTVKISGKGIKVKISNVQPGNVKLKLQLTPKEKKLLKKKGKLKLKVTITYTPTGGTPVTKHLTVTVVAKNKSNHGKSHSKH
jgi:hypothetical protein